MIKKLKELIDNDINKKYCTDKFTDHSYLNIYSELFDSCSDNVKNILEIGVYHGGSFLLWDDYFKNAYIHGVDKAPSPVKIPMSNRMIYHIGDAYSELFINNNFKDIKFDMIIDDGPHTLESMIFFVKHYSKLLSDNGALILEDIHSVEWISEIYKNFPDNLKDRTRIIDNRYINGRWDDIVIVVDRLCNY